MTGKKADAPKESPVLSVDEIKAERENVLGQFMVDFFSESDRGSALLGATYLDISLRILLESFLRVPDGKKQLSETASKRLFKGSDALFGTFSRRIDACYYLGLISSQDKNDLDAIRKIRNEFAHELIEQSFASPVILKECHKLSTGGFDANADHIDTPKKKFEMVVAMLAANLHIYANYVDRVDSNHSMKAAWDVMGRG